MMERIFYDIFEKSDFYGWDMLGSSTSLDDAIARCDEWADELKKECRVYEKRFPVAGSMESKYKIVYKTAKD